VQDDIIFTYNVLCCAQNVVQLVPPLNCIVSIREARYKLARYYATTTATTSNQTSGRCTTWTMTPGSGSTWPSPALASPPNNPPHERLTAKLQEVEATRLQPL
jgi:hypothetical protein